MVSNGYITREAFFDIYRYIDAANIDLKAFTENFYAKITLTHLQPVLDTLKWLRHETGVWFEMTNLIIPTLNDGDSEFKELCDWVLNNLGDDVPLHFTAFHPDFKLPDKPATPPETLHRARRLAMQMGLKYVYEGNIFSDGAKHHLPRMQAGGDHALMAFGDVESAEERLLHKLRHAHRRRIHESRSREAERVGGRQDWQLTTHASRIYAEVIRRPPQCRSTTKHAMKIPPRAQLNQDRPDQPTNVSMTGQSGHRDQDPLLKSSDSDYPEAGQNEEHSGEPQGHNQLADDSGCNQEGKTKTSGPGISPEGESNKSKDDPLAS